MQDIIIKDLTEREILVLSLMAKGLSNIGISQKLNITIATVRTHVYNIYSKLGLFVEDFYGEKKTMRVNAVLYYLKEFTNGNK